MSSKKHCDGSSVMWMNKWVKPLGVQVGFRVKTTTKNPTLQVLSEGEGVIRHVLLKLPNIMKVEN